MRFIREPPSVSAAREQVRRSPKLHSAALKCKEAVVRSTQAGLLREPFRLRKVYIETSSACDGDCPFCPSSVHRKTQALMPEALFDKVAGELAGTGFDGSVAFHCNNEPLLDDRLETLVARARRSLKKNFFYLYSNGSRATVDRMNALFRAGLDLAVIDNYDDSLRLTPQVEALRARESALEGEVVVKVRRSSEYLGNRAGQSPNAEGTLPRPLRLVCLRPLCEMPVAFDGSVPICCADAAGKTVIGNVLKERVQDIWLSPRAQRLRQSLVRGDRSCAECCHGCDALDFIRGI